MSYETPAALRAALEARLVNASRATGTDLDRLRRRVVFERILARLATATGERWILKGGFALEVRLGDRARATRDLDVALGESAEDGADVRDALIDTLATNAGDGFTFAVARQQEIVPDEAGRPGWRFSVTATLAGREFQRVRIDVVARLEEIAGRTEHIRMPTFLDFAGLDDLSVEAVDRRQHFAEKLHALTRDYGDRPNTRVKDLPDLLTLIEHGLEPDEELLAAVASLFEARRTHPIPHALPDPPVSWQSRCAGSPGRSVGWTWPCVAAGCGQSAPCAATPAIPRSAIKLHPTPSHRTSEDHRNGPRRVPTTRTPRDQLPGSPASTPLATARPRASILRRALC